MFHAHFVLSAGPPTPRMRVHCFAATVNVSDIRTGKSVAVLGSGLRAADIQRQLRSVTALFFDEESNLLFTGNKQGRVKVWGRG